MNSDIYLILILIGIVLGFVSCLLNRNFGAKFAYIPIILITLALIVLDVIILFNYDSSNFWGFLAIFILAYPYGVTLSSLIISWVIFEKIIPRKTEL